MIPRITFGFIVFIAVAYIIGARYPMLAQRIGLA